MISSALGLTDNEHALRNKNYPTCLSTCKKPIYTVSHSFHGRLVFQTNIPISNLSSIYPATRSHPCNKLHPVSVENSLNEHHNGGKKLTGYYVTPWAPQGLRGWEKHICVSEPYKQGLVTQALFIYFLVHWLPKFNSYFYYLISQRAWLDLWHTSWWTSQTSQL